MFHGKVSLPEDVDISNKLIKYHDFNINQKAQRERERERETHRVAQPAGLTAGHYPTWSTIEPSDSQSTNVKDALFEGNGKCGFPPTTWDRYGKLRICVSFPERKAWISFIELWIYQRQPASLRSWLKYGFVTQIQISSVSAQFSFSNCNVGVSTIHHV